MKTVQWEIPVIITLFSSRHNKAIFMRFPDARTLRWDTVRIVKHLTLQRKIQFEPCVQTKYQIATSKCLCSAYFSTSKRWNCYATPTGGSTAGQFIKIITSADTDEDSQMPFWSPDWSHPGPVKTECSMAAQSYLQCQVFQTRPCR